MTSLICVSALKKQRSISSHLDFFAERASFLEAETQQRLDQLATLMLDTDFRGQLLTDDIEGTIDAG